MNTLSDTLHEIRHNIQGRITAINLHDIVVGETPKEAALHELSRLYKSIEKLKPVDSGVV